jgi:hypothetical protein
VTKIMAMLLIGKNTSPTAVAVMSAQGAARVPRGSGGSAEGEEKMSRCIKQKLFQALHDLVGAGPARGDAITCGDRRP